jgi:hypothetical protein
LKYIVERVNFKWKMRDSFEKKSLLWWGEIVGEKIRIAFRN